MKQQLQQVSTQLQFPIIGTLAQLRQQFPEHIILLRLGDFYEAFDRDAETVAEVCGVVLCSRARGARQPMAGIPYYCLEQYAKMLTAAGHKVAVADPFEVEA